MKHDITRDILRIGIIDSYYIPFIQSIAKISVILALPSTIFVHSSRDRDYLTSDSTGK